MLEFLCVCCSLKYPRCGFGLLMYGFGSKKALLEDFASTALTECGVLVINGYLPWINLKQVHLYCFCTLSLYTNITWFNYVPMGVFF